MQVEKNHVHCAHVHEHVLELEDEESDGSVRPLEHSDDESEDGTNCLDLAKFPVPAGLSEEKGGGEPGGGEGSQ